MNELEQMASGLDLLDPKKVQEFLAEAQEQIAQLPDQIEIPLRHFFSKSVYGREMELKKGSLIIGKIHKFENMHVLSKGDVSILSIDGIVRIKAPHTWVASAGSKRLIYAHEDVVWTTFHGTNETDLAIIENKIPGKK